MSDTDIALSAQQKILLDNIISDMDYHGDWCFYVVAEQDTRTYGGYIPTMVFRDVQSFFPMNGPIYGDVPFIIGQTLSEARQRCKLMNEYIQLDSETVAQILESAGLEID